MRILAVKLRAIGDTVIWTAALQALRDCYPDAEIHTLTYKSNEAVLKNNPAINVQHYLSGRSNPELILNLLKFRREKFTWLLGFHATTSLCRWAWLAGAEKIALHHHSRQFTPRGSVLIAHAGALEDAITRDQRVIEAMHAKPHNRTTHIEVSQSERAKAEKILSDEIQKQHGNPNLPRYMFLPGAGHHLRRVPKEMWLPLAVKVLKDKRFQPVVVVDEALSAELKLRAECGQRQLPLIDQGGLRDFIVMVSLGQRALANDSGPGHIAVALGLQTSFAFGPGCVGDWHPYDRSQHPLFRIEVPCRAEGPRDQEKFQFCTVDQCSHHSCMRGLDITL